MTQYSKEVMKALDKSIEHWEENCRVEISERQYGPKDCALCHMFHAAFKGTGIGCKGCPIADKTGKLHCVDTPYQGAVEGYSTELDELMLKFLTDLREELTNETDS